MNRINVRHTDDRGIAKLVGLVVSIVLTRLWLAGDLSDWLGMFFRSVRGEEGMTSASYVVVAFLADLIYGVGTVAIVIWSGLWWLIGDVADGWRQWRSGGEAVAIDPVAESNSDSEAVSEVQGGLEGVLQTIVENMESLQLQIDAMSKPNPAARRSTAK